MGSEEREEVKKKWGVLLESQGNERTTGRFRDVVDQWVIRGKEKTWLGKRKLVAEDRFVGSS